MSPKRVKRPLPIHYVDDAVLRGKTLCGKTDRPSLNNSLDLREVTCQQCLRIMHTRGLPDYWSSADALPVQLHYFHFAADLRCWISVCSRHQIRHIPQVATLRGLPRCPRCEGHSITKHASDYGEVQR